MADGKFILKANGNFGLRSGGAFDTCEGCCCPASVNVTLAGFDGNHCTGCVIDRKEFLNSAGFNGTFSVPLLTNGAQRCIYATALTDLGSTMDQRIYHGTLPLCTNLRASGTEDLLEIIIDIWKPGFGVGIRTIDINSSNSTGTTNLDSSNVFAIGVAAGPYAMSVAHTNQQLCPSPQNNPGTGYTHYFVSSHGTGTVRVDYP